MVTFVDPASAWSATYTRRIRAVTPAADRFGASTESDTRFCLAVTASVDLPRAALVSRPRSRCAFLAAPLVKDAKAPEKSVRGYLPDKNAASKYDEIVAPTFRSRLERWDFASEPATCVTRTAIGTAGVPAAGTSD